MMKEVKEAVPKVMSLILEEVDPISSKVSSDTETLHLFLPPNPLLSKSIAISCVERFKPKGEGGLRGKSQMSGLSS